MHRALATLSACLLLLLIMPSTAAAQSVLGKDDFMSRISV